MNIYTKILFTIGVGWGLLAFVLLILAWQHAIKGNIKSHRLFMVILTLMGWLFLFYYIAHNTLLDSPVKVPSKFVPWLVLHGSVAMGTLIAATIMLWAKLTDTGMTKGIRYCFIRNHRTFGRMIVPCWLFTHAGGILNLWLFY